ncbi:long-chain fatty acid transport protein 2-like [Brachyhypopomus gauderio]|uniref:long-chain fatty acid transport protein 2-like n=1 Tax=Brachyhypopomus gauderio TaxID=698409 RepID=UPI0040413634
MLKHRFSWDRFTVALDTMYVWFTLVAGLAILPVILKTLFPYFFQDCLYILRAIRFGVRLDMYKKRRPFYSILDGFLDSVRKHPHKPLMHFEGKTFSYLDMDRESNKVAGALRSAAGLKEGDTAAMFLGNEPWFTWTWLGLAKLGCTAALLNFNIRSKSLLHCFSCCGANVLIASEELCDAVEEILPALKEKGIRVYIINNDCDTHDIKGLCQAVTQASDQPLPPSLRANVNARSTALYIYTSGTTGLPKAAVVTQERLWAASFIQGMSGVTSEDVFYINLPLYHSAGFLIGFTGCIERGNSFVLRRKFSASQFWDDCRKYNVTVMQYIGETLRYLCSVPKKHNDRDHTVRIAIGNGVRQDIWNEFLRRFGNILVRELYAATEGNVGFINYTSKVGSVGRVNILNKRIFPHTLIKFDVEKDEPVRNTEGLCVPVSPGEPGLLVGKITTKSPFIGYAGNKQQTEKKRLRDVFVKGDLYFNSGDLLRIDCDNFVYFHDRVGDTFRWKGENVATTEVSDVLTMVDCIEEANVYGVAVQGHEGRIGMAAVTLKEGREFDCVNTYSVVTNYLPVYARPRFIRVQNSLEVTGTFKMKKVKLVEEGFNTALIQDPVYFLDLAAKKYIPFTQEIYNSVISGEMKL